MVYFIQNNMIQLGEVQFIVLDVVFDATGGSNQNINPITDSIDYKGGRGAELLIFKYVVKYSQKANNRHIKKIGKNKSWALISMVKYFST